MNIELFSDSQIMEQLGKRYDFLRRKKGFTDREIAERAGISTETLHRFRTGQGVSLQNFVRLMRAIGELARLDTVLPEEDTVMPSIPQVKVPKHKVRKSKTRKTINWENDEWEKQ